MPVKNADVTFMLATSDQKITENKDHISIDYAFPQIKNILKAMKQPASQMHVTLSTFDQMKENFINSSLRKHVYCMFEIR